MTQAETLYGTIDTLVSGYERMRDLVIKAASKAPEVVLEKVASIPERVNAQTATSVVDTLVKRGFVNKSDRELTIRMLCTAKPDAICEVIEKIASKSIPVDQTFEHRLEDRGGVPEPSAYSTSSNQAWLEAGKNTKNKR